MPRPKLSGPCAVSNCTKHTPFYRTFSENAYKTAQQEETLHNFAYLEVGHQLCCTHYNNIVALSRNRKKKCSRAPSCKQAEDKNDYVTVHSNQEKEGEMQSSIYSFPLRWFFPFLCTLATFHPCSILYNKELPFVLQTVLLQNKSNCLHM